MIKDPVNPDYYKGDDVMQIIERYNLGFCLGNTVKYILRSGKKVDDKINQVSTQKEHSAIVITSTLTDLKKALWYLEREISNLEKGLK